MKKIYVILTLIIGISLSSCENKIIDLVVKINDTFDYNADNSGTFTDSYTVTSADILDNFDYDVSGIEDVNISYLELLVQENNGNQASRIRATGTFLDNNTATPIVVFQDLEFNIADFSSSPQVITGYQIGGINALADKLAGFINATDLSDFTLSITGTAIDGSGNPVPEIINLDMSLTLDAEVIFEEEASLPAFP